MIPKWEYFPENFRNQYVKKYYDYILTKKKSLVLKRVFDILSSLFLIVLLSFVMIIIGLVIKATSKGPIFYRQKRVTQYGRVFYIIKFRTMKEKSDCEGSLTCDNDSRITPVGKFLRKFRLDEIPQLINVFLGQMTFVGARPEVPEYVEHYTDEMLATLILPAGVTSFSSIEFRDESKYLKMSENPSKTYVEQILPSKMKYNMDYLSNFNLFFDIKIMFLTLKKVFIG